MTSSMAESWSSVSSYGKRAANSRNMPSAESVFGAVFSSRSAASRISSSAMSMIFFLARALRDCHPAPPSLSSAPSPLSAP